MKVLAAMVFVATILLPDVRCKEHKGCDIKLKDKCGVDPGNNADNNGNTLLKVFPFKDSTTCDDELSMESDAKVCIANVYHLSFLPPFHIHSKGLLSVQDSLDIHLKNVTIGKDAKLVAHTLARDYHLTEVNLQQRSKLTLTCCNYTNIYQKPINKIELGADSELTISTYIVKLTEMNVAEGARVKISNSVAMHTGAPSSPASSFVTAAYPKCLVGAESKMNLHEVSAFTFAAVEDEKNDWYSWTIGMSSNFDVAFGELQIPKISTGKGSQVKVTGKSVMKKASLHLKQLDVKEGGRLQVIGKKTTVTGKKLAIGKKASFTVESEGNADINIDSIVVESGGGLTLKIGYKVVSIGHVTVAKNIQCELSGVGLDSLTKGFFFKENSTAPGVVCIVVPPTDNGWPTEPDNGGRLDKCAPLSLIFSFILVVHRLQ